LPRLVVVRVALGKWNADALFVKPCLDVFNQLAAHGQQPINQTDDPYADPSANKLDQCSSQRID